METNDPIAFSSSLEHWARVELKGDMRVLMRAVAFDVFRNLNEATPVGNPDLWKSLKIGYQSPSMKYPRKTKGKAPKGYVGGTARASWFISPLRPEATPVIKNTPSKFGVSEGLIAITALNGNEIWIANNLPYIERIMEDGWSTQAPPGTFSQIALYVRNKWGLDT